MGLLDGLMGAAGGSGMMGSLMGAAGGSDMMSGLLGTAAGAIAQKTGMDQGTITNLLSSVATNMQNGHSPAEALTAAASEHGLDASSVQQIGGALAQHAGLGDMGGMFGDAAGADQAQSNDENDYASADDNRQDDSNDYLQDDSNDDNQDDSDNQ
jgi:predicted lipid-binding transport protein (Tim44 family)